jgi:hypothetical protein
MRVGRIRKFKNSIEVTLVLDKHDGQALCHAIDCGSKKDYKCFYPERFLLGKQLLRKLYQEVFLKAWFSWD